MHLARRCLLLPTAAGVLLTPPARAADPAGAATPAADRVQASVQDLRAAEIGFAPLAAVTREVMRHELGTLLAPASLGLAWRVAQPSDETDHDELRVVLMRTAGVGGDAQALGSTSRGGLSPTIWIYLPTLAHALGLELDAVATSFEDQRTLGVAMGRVLAHEVVHLLAPRIEHAEAGVMRSRLHAFYLTRGRPALENECLKALTRGAGTWLSTGGPSPIVAFRAR